MGAVIDESMQQRIEVCVLGTTDMGGRGIAVRRPATGQRASANPFARPAATKNATATTGDPAGPAPFTETTQPATAGGKAKTKQDEFAFGEMESRGYFDKTDRNLFEGQDLDVPTYLRKGVRIAV